MGNLSLAPTRRALGGSRVRTLPACGVRRRPHHPLVRSTAMSGDRGNVANGANGAALKEKTGTRSGLGDGAIRSVDQSELLSASTAPASPADKATRTAYEGGRRLLSPAHVEASRDPQIAFDKSIMLGRRPVSTAPGP